MSFSYSIISVGTPIFPQYFRDAHVYKEIEVFQNLTIRNRCVLFLNFKPQIDICQPDISNKMRFSRTTVVNTTRYENEAIYNSVLFASYEATQVISLPVYGLVMGNRYVNAVRCR